MQLHPQLHGSDLKALSSGVLGKLGFVSSSMCNGMVLQVYKSFEASRLHSLAKHRMEKQLLGTGMSASAIKDCTCCLCGLLPWHVMAVPGQVQGGRQSSQALRGWLIMCLSCPEALFKYVQLNQCDQW
eukprot:6462784-Amphidinium_carterae.2